MQSEDIFSIWKCAILILFEPAKFCVYFPVGIHCVRCGVGDRSIDRCEYITINMASPTLKRRYRGRRTKSEKNKWSPKDGAFANKICKLGPVSKIWIWNHLITITINYPDELSSQWPMAFSFARAAKSLVVKLSNVHRDRVSMSMAHDYPGDGVESDTAPVHVQVLCENPIYMQIKANPARSSATIAHHHHNRWQYFSLPCGWWLQWLVFGHWYPISINRVA